MVSNATSNEPNPMAERRATSDDLPFLLRSAPLLGIGGLVLLALGAAIGFLMKDSGGLNAALTGYLYAWMFWLAVAGGGLALSMLHHMTGGNWGRLVRPVFESAALTMPLVALAWIPLGIAIWTVPEQLFPWGHLHAHHHEVDAGAAAAGGHAEVPYVEGHALHALEHQYKTWLNPLGYTIRAVVFFAVWIGFAYFVPRVALRYRREPSERTYKSMRGLCAAGILFYAVSMSLVSVDYMMAREPGWYSSIMGFQLLVMQCLTVMLIAVLAVLSLYNRRDAVRRMLTPPLMNDLGNLVFCLVILWAYLTFFQFLIIYSANIDHETPWYVRRGLGEYFNGFKWVGTALCVLHFLVPFLLLLIRFNKRQPRILASICVGVLVMRLVDLFWNIGPSGLDAIIGDDAPSLGVWGLRVAASLLFVLGLGGLALAVLGTLLARRDLPTLDEDYVPGLAPAALGGGSHATTVG